MSTALSLFVQLDASGWAQRARDELHRLGVASGNDARPPVALSPLEHQVAMAAAMGGTARTIAAGLFLSEATVGAALTSATAKLGIATPDDLAGRMGELAAIGPSVSALTAGTVPGEGHAARQASGPAIRLLGPCEVVVGGAVVDCPAGLLGQALKRVALAGRLPIEELMEELWPGAAPGAGRQRLRTLLTRLRQVVGPLLMRDGDWIRLAPEVEVDTLRFEELAGAAEAAAAARDPQAGELAGRALKLYRGELLPTDRHLDFTSGRRERLRRRYLSMVTIAVDHVAPGQVDRAVRLLEAAITEDPHEETLYIRAAALLATADRAGEAASFLRRARAALAELGVEPSSEAVELDRSLTRR